MVDTVDAEDLEDSIEDLPLAKSMLVLDGAYDLNFKERWLLYHEHIKAKKWNNTWTLDSKPSPFQLWNDFHYALRKVVRNEGDLIESLNEDEQNDDLEELYNIITMYFGKDFELVDKELQDEPVDPSDEHGTHYKIVHASFDIIQSMSELCRRLKWYGTQRIYLKMATNFILRAFDINGHFHLIDMILSQSLYIVSSYIACMQKLNKVEIALEDLTAIITTFEKLGVKKPRNYGYLLKAKGEALEAINRLDEAIFEYKKSIKCSKKYYLFHIQNSKNCDPHDLVHVYEEPVKHLYKLYVKLGRHQEAIEVIEKFFETIGPTVEAHMFLIHMMKLDLAKSYMKIRKYHKAKQSLLSITHKIRERTKESLAREPLFNFHGEKLWFTSVFDVLELYFQCIELKPSPKKKSLPKIAQHLLDHMKNEDFVDIAVAKEPQIINFDDWVETIMAVTLDCLKDNIQYVDLSEIYVLKLKHMMMRERADNIKGIEFGLKVLKVLKKNDGLDFLPQVCQQMYDLYCEIGYVHEALDLRMESADYSSIDSKWHIDMANCYLDIDQYDEAWSHINDILDPDAVDRDFLRMFALFCIQTGRYEHALNMKGSKTDPFLIDLQSLILFKLTKFQECISHCIRQFKRGITLNTFMRMCSAYLFFDEENVMKAIDIIHENHYETNSSFKCVLKDVWKNMLNHRGVKSGGFEDLVRIIFTILDRWREKFHVKKSELRLYENAFAISNHIRMKRKA